MLMGSTEDSTLRSTTDNYYLVTLLRSLTVQLIILDEMNHLADQAGSSQNTLEKPKCHC
jgi:hypothetical protein